MTATDPIVRVFQSELDALHAQVAQLEGYDRQWAVDQDRADRAEAALKQAEARVDDLTDTLKLRSNALNATGRDNDALRARLADVERTIELARDLADTWETVSPHQTMPRVFAAAVLREVIGQ